MRNLASRNATVVALIVSISAVFASTASAWEPHDIWTVEGSYLTSTESFQATGLVGWTVGPRLECSVNAELMVMPNGRVEIANFSSDECVGTESYSGCEVTTTQMPYGQKWQLQAEEDGTVRGEARWNWQFESCDDVHYQHEWEARTELVLEPIYDENGSIDSFEIVQTTLYGYSQGEQVFQTSGVYGTLEPEEAAYQGRYGLVEAPEASAPGLWMVTSKKTGHVDPIEGDTEVEFSGSVTALKPNGYSGEVTCGVSVTATFGVEGEGELTEFTYDPETCVATGDFEECEVVSGKLLTAASLEAKAGEMVAPNNEARVVVKWEGGEGCAISEIAEEIMQTTVSLEGISFTPDDVNIMSSIALSGETPFSEAAKVFEPIGTTQMSGEVVQTSTGNFGLEPAP